MRLSYLFYRDAVRKSTVWLSAWPRTSSNHIDDVEVELQRHRMAGWELGLNYRGFISTAILDAALSYMRGTGFLRSGRAPEEPFGEGTSRPEIILANLSLNMPFSFLEQNMRYTFQYRGQKNLTPLVPQDRFSIGSRYTVRGFDGEMVLMGDRGWLVRNDLGIAVPKARSEFYLGADYGKVGGQATKYMSGNKHLSGAVASIRGAHRGVYWDFFIGAPISKPDGLQTMNVVSGFNIGWSY